MSRYTPREIIAILEEEGYSALFVGGYVRDRLLGLPPDDADIATSASPEQVVQIFRHKAQVKEQGKHFGVVVVDGVEVAMFRGESYSIPGKPDVYPARDFAQDASRRDFTINALGMTAAGEVLDPMSGAADLRARLIRAVGDPETRFREDPARLLRAVTFAARLDFRIEDGTAVAIQRNAHLLETLPVERVAKELAKMLDRHVLHRGLVLLSGLGLICYVFPEWSTPPGINWPMTLAAVAQAEQIGASRAVVFAALAVGCMDLPACAEQASALILRLGFGRPLAKRAAHLIDLAAQMDKLSRKPRSVLDWLRQMAAACRNRSEMKMMVEELWQLQQAKRTAQADLVDKAVQVADLRLRSIVSDMLEQVPWYPADAGINGSNLGLKGPALGRRIAELLKQAQLDALARLSLKS